MLICAPVEEAPSHTRARAPRATPHGIIVDEGHALRREAEVLIERVYRDTFEVALHSHFPVIVAVLDLRGRVAAAAGCRRAGEEELFLEHYLDTSIECALSSAASAQIVRAQIAEIGNLATSETGGATPLFAALAAHLRADGATYAVATATRRLRRAFSTFGFGAAEIAKAQRARLPQGGCDWGRYFDHDPVVVWGCVSAGLRDAELGTQL